MTGTPNYFPRRNPPLANNPIGRKARVGDTVDFRFCYGNRGNAAKTTSTAFDFALSTNSTLEAADTRITNNNWSVATMSANEASCFTFNMTVPNVATGFYNIIGKFGTGSAATSIAVVNRQIEVVP